ncbi:hypothetical protein C8J57DRAFT_679427 [Mycena rebaudengoi]|nr:hypothetical protein C8J57DRAFT_679427 [Mycena rebaudengoi]
MSWPTLLVLSFKLFSILPNSRDPGDSIRITIQLGLPSTRNDILTLRGGLESQWRRLLGGQGSIRNSGPTSHSPILLWPPFYLINASPSKILAKSRSCAESMRTRRNPQFSPLTNGATDGWWRFSSTCKHALISGDKTKYQGSSSRLS